MSPCRTGSARALSLLLLLLLLSSSSLVLSVLGSSASDGDEDDDEDDFEPHQLVIIGVDGLRGSASTSRWMPFVHRMASTHGVYTPKARTVTTTVSMPGWIAVLYAATPAEYGCSNNREHCAAPAEVGTYRSLLDVLEYERSYSITVMAEHEIIDRALRGQRPVERFSSDGRSMLERLSDEHRLPQTDRRALFVHFDGVDHVGHAMGYESPNYLAQVRCVDWQISQIVDRLWRWEPQRTTFVVVADHGGRGFEHEGLERLSLDTLQVPLAMWGYGVPSGVTLFSEAVDSVQLAPTLLTLLGYGEDIPPYWLHPPIAPVVRAAIDQRLITSSSSSSTLTERSDVRSVRGFAGDVGSSSSSSSPSPSLSHSVLTVEHPPPDGDGYHPECPSHCPTPQLAAHRHATVSSYLVLACSLLALAVSAFGLDATRRRRFAARWRP